jgi:hypothetical protein
MNPRNTWNKQDLSAAQRFGLRFLVSFVVLGALYCAVFGIPHFTRHRPATVKQKFASVQAAINQSAITSASMADFQENSAVSYDTLGNLINELRNNTKDITKARLALGNHLPAAESNAIQTITAKQAAAIKALDARNALLSIVMAYDPATDFGNIDLHTGATKVATRAAAAQNGLRTVIQNSGKQPTEGGLAVDGVDGAPALLNPGLQTALETEAACLGQLASQASAGQFDQAATSRASCMAAYPELRHKAMRATIDGAISSDYQEYLKRTIPPLLKKLSNLQSQS